MNPKIVINQAKDNYEKARQYTVQTQGVLMTLIMSEALADDKDMTNLIWLLSDNVRRTEKELDALADRLHKLKGYA